MRIKEKQATPCIGQFKNALRQYEMNQKVENFPAEKQVEKENIYKYSLSNCNEPGRYWY